MQARRLESGGRIDRSKLVSFSFNGQQLSGYVGDTLASALLANNISLVSRSIKYHRPRGILAAGLEEPSALVSCADEHRVFVPNFKATELRLKDGLAVRSQNFWPSLKIDFGTLLQIGSAILTAGFYYKTFMWPRQWWHRIYEKMIRRIAGQGRISYDMDSKRYDKRHINCDVLIIGSGPHGINAALSAAESDVQVVLVEQDRELGGSALWEKKPVDSTPADQWLEERIVRLGKFSNCRCVVNTLAFGQYDHGLVLAVEQKSGYAETIFWRIRAKRIEFATGSTERPLVFANNDRPGIMLAASVRQYIYRYAVKPGTAAFLAVSDADERRLTEQALLHAGIAIAGSLAEGEIITGTSGWQQLRKVHLVDKQGVEKTLNCDLMCVSNGWTPNAHLSAHLGDKQAFVSSQEENSNSEQHLSGRGKAFVDLQNDVTRADLELAVREGYDHIELAKRYTTTGMGTDQGKTSWTNAIAELSRLSGKDASVIGHTSFRPPYSPVSFGALMGADTGEFMVPTRRTPFHRVFEESGCVFQTSGDWVYSRYFPMKNETMEQAIQREVKTVRNAVGCVDMSTLGKVDVKGSDALEFLSRIYCNNLETIRPDRLRYVLMLREDGLLYDDGTVAQLADNHFLVTMTTANAGQTWRWMNKMLQLQWPDLDVQLTSVTDHWASLAIAGPESRNLLSDLAPDFEIDKNSFPFASVKQGELDQEIRCRVFTVSFSGELAYEINVPAGFASRLFQMVMDSGESYGITPYGLEALDVLRIEKGHISVGTEIDGRTAPADLGLGKMVSSKKAFIGSSLLQRPALKKPNRLQLVGLKPADGKTSIPAAGHLTDEPWRAGKIQASFGRLTAAVESPTMGHSIALALLNNGHQRLNEKLWAVSPVNKQSVEVIVGPNCFYDNEGDRLHD
jgi:glycine cleavage system aminomethyltransferase T/NADPH-dependent 2,4-dienoyl-CoA reductase/sulfur reductase-like enzyme